MTARARPVESSLRADAARNRRALVDAAHVVFGRQGLDAPLDEIARQAAVGNATLYRHFPNRCALVAAVFEDTLAEVGTAARRALEDPDPWTGFTEHVLFLCRLQASDRGLADLLTTTITAAPELERLRKRARLDLARIIARAKNSGALRDDFEPEDLIVLLMANAGVVRRTSVAAPGAWQRLVGYTLDGLRAPAATATVPASCADAVRRAMADHAIHLGCT
jgi:AcrR family transcriptional regulator